MMGHSLILLLMHYLLLLSSDSSSFKLFYQEFTKKTVIPEENYLVSWMPTSDLPEGSCFRSHPLCGKHGA